MKKFNLIFLNTGKLFISSKRYCSWKEIQDEYENYSASVEFESLEEIIDYIVLDYKLEKEFVLALLDNYRRGNEQAVELIF